MTLRNHLVTMTNGECLAKTNQRTNYGTHCIFCVDCVLSLHKLQCICFRSTSFLKPNDLKQDNFFTNNSPAIAISSFLQLSNDGPAHFGQLPVLNDDPAFKQFSIPHDGPAHFKQLSVPPTAKNLLDFRHMMTTTPV
jgi:hypothetical protein